MTALSRADLWSLEEYAERRPTFRTEIMAHKKDRQVALGEHARLYFEDKLTIRYQIQEMLRIEKVFEADGINEELEAYNPLIPDGHNWKATFMIEYDEPQERAQQLSQMIGIEDKVWLQVESCERVYPITDEDLERDNEHKTSSVHFLRFELTPSMIAAVHRGGTVCTGVDHPAYTVESMLLAPAVRDSLANDLQASAIN
ncbi:MAG: DUF3501 domain-containing protein [Gammaproteobacteria bacterium]|nr:MAG: DUF3501 domain-containing protein [Gammaproteobacteria bacterium]RLA56942.1 MAG: DUF3501 domain-containing protein [Gammaproteobacteria bacterium]HDY81625.1 DUF3501 family protein [Halieaceae bacterium]